jgi:hypothetical protein
MITSLHVALPKSVKFSEGQGVIMHYCHALLSSPVLYVTKHLRSLWRPCCCSIVTDGRRSSTSRAWVCPLACHPFFPVTYTSLWLDKGWNTGLGFPPHCIRPCSHWLPFFFRGDLYTQRPSVCSLDWIHTSVCPLYLAQGLKYTLPLG